MLKTDRQASDELALGVYKVSVWGTSAALRNVDDYLVDAGYETQDIEVGPVSGVQAIIPDADTAHHATFLVRQALPDWLIADVTVGLAERF